MIPFAVAVRTTLPLRVVGPASCQAIRLAEGQGAANQGKHTLHPDAFPVCCPSEEGFVHLPGRDGLPCPSTSSYLNSRRRFNFPTPWPLHCLLPTRTVVSASPTSPSSDLCRHPAVPQGVFRQQGEHSKAKVLQDAAQIVRGDVRDYRSRRHRYFRDHVMPVKPHEVERQHGFGQDHWFLRRLLHDLWSDCEESGAPFLPERLAQGVLRPLVHVLHHRKNL